MKLRRNIPSASQKEPSDFIPSDVITQSRIFHLKPPTPIEAPLKIFPNRVMNPRSKMSHASIYAPPFANQQSRSSPATRISLHPPTSKPLFHHPQTCQADDPPFMLHPL